jgi:iron complex outermembrane receptor protein
MFIKLRVSTLALSIAVALGTTNTYAEDTGALAEQNTAQTERIVVVGSRASPRSILDSPVPVDVISGVELGKSGSSDILDQLVSAVPSLNARSQPISDAATFIRPINLRGLPSDSTLILVNGKRRHRAAVIAFTGGGINDGSQGVDISVIPSIALKQVEVLRDGAAAQYGSDAIAGVMNFVLKNTADGGSLEVKYGEYYEGDGSSITVAGNVGMPLTDEGFINLSFQAKNADGTSRSVQSQEGLDAIATGNMNIRQPATIIWGNPEIEDDITLFGNVGFDLSTDKELYMFGNYSERTVSGGYYYRSPINKDGVFTDGNGELLVADLTSDMSGNCPSVPLPGSGNVLETSAYLQVAADPNCFTFHEMFPGGYTPTFGGDINDTSLVIGTKGKINKGILEETYYDISGSYGRSKASFTLSNAVNPSLGPNTPTIFNVGSYTQLEKTFNADVMQLVDLGSDYQMNIAMGVEWREDSFEIVSGQIESWESGPLASQGFGITTAPSGFAGFTPESQGTNSRRSVAVFLDTEMYVTDDFMLGGAVRYEDYSTFGDTTNFKLTTQYSISDELSLRGSFNTGFRAPTVGQASVINTTTTTDFSGNLTSAGLFPASHSLSQFYGATELTPEDSNSYTFGLVYQNENFFFTADYYTIEVTDRITQSSSFTVEAKDYDALKSLGVDNPEQYSQVRYFSNDFDTTTQGFDLVANYSLELLKGDAKLSLAYNWNDTEVDTFNPDTTNELKVRRLEDEMPHHRATFTVAQTWDKVSMFVRTNIYGAFYAVHADGFGGRREASSSFTLDVELSYFATDSLSFSVGASNLLDTEPEKIDGDFENYWWKNYGGQYFENSPFDFNGGYYYVKATYDF